MVVDSGQELMETWFSAEARSTGSARHAVRTSLGRADHRLIAEIELLTSELFVHAASASHGLGRICIRIRQTSRRIHVEVAHEPADDGAARLATRDPLEAQILDRLLDAFAVDWGRSAASDGGGVTWFDMPQPG